MKDLLILATILFSNFTYANEISGDLTVILTGFANDVGSVKIALVNSKESFITRVSDDNPLRKVSAPISNGKATYVFQSVSFGQYAIMCFHDENSNNDLDTNVFGAPLEGYGFSNNAREAFGPPTYDDARFVFSFESSTVAITIQ